MDRLRADEIASLINSREAGFAENSSCEWRAEGVTTDSRSVPEGSLFVPIAGERFDGHLFIDAARAAGAAGALTHEPYSGSCPTVRVKNTRTALKYLAGAYRDKFSLLMTAVTGSVGKTTTKELTAAVLSAGYRTHRTDKNKNNDIGVPLTLLGISAHHTACVTELGMSAAGEIAELTRLAKPDIGVITNIGTSHIEYLGSRENILRAKLEITEGMQPGGVLVLNADDDMLSGASLPGQLRTVWCGIEAGSAEVRAENISAERDGTDFTAVWPGGRQRVRVNMAGLHNVRNAISAFAVGMCAGIEPENAAEAIAAVRPVGLRQHTVRVNGAEIIMDCYNANPDSMRASLAVLAGARGRRIAFLGDMLELGTYAAKAHRDTGILAASCCDVLVTVGEYAEQTAKAAVSAGLPKESAHLCATRAEAAQTVKELLREGDTLLVKGSRSMKMEELVETAPEE